MTNFNPFATTEPLNSRTLTSRFDALDTALSNTTPPVPTGAVVPYGGASAPTGWLNCDGAAVSRTTYAALFAITGTTYGVGDGSTTFNLPDLRGRNPVGVGAGVGLTTRNPGDQFGEEAHQLTTSELPAHTHTIYFGSAGTVTGGSLSGDGSGTSDPAGGDVAHNNMQPSLVAQFIIKV